MSFPDTLHAIVQPLFNELPLSEAMPELLPAHAAAPEKWALVEALALKPEILANPSVLAGLWMYVDDLDRSHSISQSIQSPVGALWHGVMHRREGDFWNSKYWLRQANAHPALGEFDPSEFVDQVELAGKSNSAALIAIQREEWKRLFDWCVQESKP